MRLVYHRRGGGSGGRGRSGEEAFGEGVLYALDYLSGLFEGVEDTDLASEYGFEKEGEA